MLNQHFSKSGEAITFDGKRVLVTGGTGGIGKAIALKLMQCGASVTVLDYDDVALKELNC
jgi:NAD(P)-dependent dehydrogenase (short-subunit alcohol dehydrogenase family)